MVDLTNSGSFPSACMLFQGEHAHRSHRRFAEAIDAEYRHFETGRQPIEGTNQDIHSELARIKTARSLPEKYEIVIAEGTAPIQTVMAYKLLNNQHTVALYLAADETFYAHDGWVSTLLWKALKPVTARTIDGIIAVGRSVYEWATPYLGHLEVEVVHPPIGNGKYDRLMTLNPTSPQDKFSILSAGTTKSTNNYSELARATEHLRNSGYPVQTTILGANHPDESYADREYISTPGFVDLDTFTEHFEQASVYVQPSIGDSFPVATLEAILSGTPTLVTEGVGVKELLPDDQVVVPSVEGLADGIERMYQMPFQRRRDLGASQRNLVTDLTVNNQTKEFRRAVANFLA